MTFFLTSLMLSALFYFSTASMEIDLEPTPSPFFSRADLEARGQCTQTSSPCSDATLLLYSASSSASLSSDLALQSYTDASRSSYSLSLAYSASDDEFLSLYLAEDEATSSCNTDPSAIITFCVSNLPTSASRAFVMQPTVQPTAVFKHLEPASAEASF